MIRFCNKELHCITKEELDEEKINEYFLGGHKNEQIYILNEGAFWGCVSYNSFTKKHNGNYVIKECLTMDENIWTNGRNLFKKYAMQEVENILIPVVDEYRQLICFAWQDNEANRQLRMLDELTEVENLLNFRDIYCDYKLVTIYGCNELAFYFAKYLVNCGVDINVSGKLWKYFGLQEKPERLDYRKFEIYSEGVDIKKDAVETYKSISVEFECIDHIYEENICRGMIKDNKFEFETLLNILKEKHIAIIGIGEAAQHAYDLLLGNGIDIDYFIFEERRTGYLFGKKIVSELEARESSEKVVFIDPMTQHSAWGFGDTDYYHYMGYRRNEKFYMLQDYIDLPQNGLLNIIEHMMRKFGGRLVLLGDVWLSIKLCSILAEKNKEIYAQVVYADILNFQIEQTELKVIGEEEIDSKRDTCLLLFPDYFGNMDDPKKVKCIGRQRDECLNRLQQLEITNVIEYSLNNVYFMDWEANKSNVINSTLKVGSVVIGAINGFSGNKFFRDLLDNHPNLLMLDWSSLNNNLFLICVRLSVKKSDQVLPLFWKLCDEQQGAPDENFEKDFPQKELFSNYMKEMLSWKEQFTSQELFVMIHIAYAKMWGKQEVKISDMVIYWEPHHVPRDKCEDYARWLCNIGEHNFILNIVRNAYISAGSYLKLLNNLGSLSSYDASVFAQIFKYPNEQKEDYEGWERIVLRFEDIKCQPRRELMCFCDKINIEWSDSMLETTTHGKESSLWGVTGFDLKPVYHTYEEYFSSFDRFRISLITAPWQRKYGYPYINNADFSRRELQEMFLKEFRFEKRRCYRSNEEKERIKRDIHKIVNNYLQKNRREEIQRERNSMDEHNRHRIYTMV